MKGIQTIIAGLIMLALFIYIMLLSDFANLLWRECCGKENKYSKLKSEIENAKQILRDFEKSRLIVSDETPTSEIDISEIRENLLNNGPPRVSYTKAQSAKKSISKNFKSFLKRFLRIFKVQSYTEYFVLGLMVLFLVLLQIIFIHPEIFQINNFANFKRMRKKNSTDYLNQMCDYLEANYMAEEVLFLPPALVFLTALWFTQRRSRFNRYITVKYKNYFGSELYKSVQAENIKRRMKKIKKKEKELKNKGKCGYCRYRTYKCCKNRLLGYFCCLCCCSCCVPPGSNSRCFLWYCCCLGWRQTGFYKALKIVQKVLSCVLLMPLWKCIWRKLKESHETQKRNERRMKEKHEQRKKWEIEKQKKKAERLKKPKAVHDNDEDGHESNKDTNDLEKGESDKESTDIDEDEDVDEEDINSKQEFRKDVCPLPSIPFSTTNRAQSASVYVAYTYDVLNIFMYIYTANINPSFIPYLTKPSGVLYDLLFQFIQVLLIGLKFYPILVVADLNPNGLIYLLSTIYMLHIWVIKFISKAFCSKTEAFIKQTLKKLSQDVGGRIKSSLNVRYNISNTILGLFIDDPDPNQQYISALKTSIPSLFKEYFGRYEHGESKVDDQSLYQSDNELLSLNGISEASNYYYNSQTTSTRFYTTLTMSTTSVSYGLRDSLKNKTKERLEDAFELIIHQEKFFEKIINLLENLPLYITLSYLLARYSLLLLAYSIDRLSEKLKCCPKRKNASDSDAETQKKNNASKIVHNLITKQTMSYTVSEKERIIRSIDEYVRELNKDLEETNQLTSKILTKKNHNYSYIANLLKDVDLFKKQSSSEHEELLRLQLKRPAVSYLLNLYHTYIYERVPHLKYSKQFINTFTVAFMIIYFFTLFGLRLSHLFGNTLVRAITLVFQFIFRGVASSINFEEHNFNTEFRMTCILTSSIIFIQLICSIKNFHHDLIRLHRGEKVFNSSTNPLARKYNQMSSYESRIKERNKMSVTITSDSLHFPGYLVAHLVYGYFLLFITFFLVIVLFKLLYYLEGLLSQASQIFIPLIILVSLKFIIIKFMTKAIFLREDNQRITNLTPYYTVSYFNFFFDCFLGLIACASRIWQTTIISLITLPRLDKSMFNKDSDLIMKRLDKGHLAYMNFVRMEHWYNNPVLSGFCEMIIESMLLSQIYREKYEILAKSKITLKPLKNTSSSDEIAPKFQIKRSISKNNQTSEHTVSKTVKDNFLLKHFNRLKESRRASKIGGEEKDNEKTNEYNQVIEFKGNQDFKFSSFLRLRNLFYLCLLLRRNPSLKKLRYHYLVAETASRRLKQERVESFHEFYNKKLVKNIDKIKSNIEKFIKKSQLSLSFMKDMGLSASSSNQPEGMTHSEDADTESIASINPQAQPQRYIRPEFTIAAPIVRHTRTASL
jgi:hypothetical protein